MNNAVCLDLRLSLLPSEMALIALLVSLLVSADAAAQSRSAYLCVVAPSRTADVLAAADGTVAGLALEVGDRVNRGERVAVIGRESLVEADIDAATASVRVAEAEQRRAEVSVAQAQDRLRRVKALRNEGLVAEEQLSDAEHALSATKATAEASEAASDLQRAQLRLKKLTASQMHVLAPFDGEVSEVFMNSGQEARRGEPIVRVVDQSSFRLRCMIPSADVAQITRGTILRVTIDSLKLDFTTKVTVVSPSIDEVSQTFRVESRILKTPALAALFASAGAGLTAVAKLP